MDETKIQHSSLEQKKFDKKLTTVWKNGKGYQISILKIKAYATLKEELLRLTVQSKISNL